MSVKVKVKVMLKGIEQKINSVYIHDRKTVNEIGRFVTEGMLDAMGKGLSPVRGFGRFVAYKAQRQSSRLNAALKSLSGSKAGKRIARQMLKKEIVKAESGYYPETTYIKEHYPDKTTRPVNLKLSGELWERIDYELTQDGKAIELGIFGYDKIATIARVHNTGERLDIPQRKFLPTGKGEAFIISLTRLIKDIYLNRINDIIKVLNR